jgi:hypothetical protein
MSRCNGPYAVIHATPYVTVATRDLGAEQAFALLRENAADMRPGESVRVVDQTGRYLVKFELHNTKETTT